MNAMNLGFGVDFDVPMLSPHQILKRDELITTFNKVVVAPQIGSYREAKTSYFTKRGQSVNYIQKNRQDCFTTERGSETDMTNITDVLNMNLSCLSVNKNKN